MDNNVFETIYNKHGMYGLQAKGFDGGIIGGTKEKYNVVVIAWRSPHASAKRNLWLEKKLQRIYSRYYFMVMKDNFGMFW